MSEEAKEYINVSDLRPGLRGVNLKLKCKTKNEEREVVSKKTGETLRVTEALVGDETGVVLLTLWNDDIDKMAEENNYELSNGYTTVFKTSLRLNIGKYGNLEEIDEAEPSEVNEENNISDKKYEDQRQRPRYGGGGDRGGDRSGYGGRRPQRGNRTGPPRGGQRRRY